MDGSCGFLLKNVLSTRNNIAVNFSESHDNYYSAYKYIAKADTEVFHSGEHPNLKEIAHKQRVNKSLQK